MEQPVNVGLFHNEKIFSQNTKVFDCKMFKQELGHLKVLSEKKKNVIQR